MWDYVGLKGVGGALQMMAPHSVANIVESCEKHQINISITMIREKSLRPATRKKMKNTCIIIPRAMIVLMRMATNVMLELLMLTPMLMLELTMVMMRSVMMHQYSKSVNLDGLI